MTVQMINTQEIFWKNFDRYLELKNMTMRDISKCMGSASQNLKANRAKKANIGVRSVGHIAYAFGIQPLELFEEWTDEEWEKNMKQIE